MHSSSSTGPTICVNFCFVGAIIIIKIIGLIIAGTSMDKAVLCNGVNGTSGSGSDSTNYIGYLASCRSNSACEPGYICSTDQKCYCDPSSSNIPIVNSTACTTNSQCRNRQVCSIGTLRCAYPEVCKTGKESDKPAQQSGFNLAVWLLIYSIVGLVASVIAMAFVWMEFVCCMNGNDDDDCFGGVCICCGTWLVGVIYLLFSIGWNIYGLVILFGAYDGCRDVTPALWGYSLFNCIILYPILICNPITFELLRTRALRPLLRACCLLD